MKVMLATVAILPALLLANGIGRADEDSYSACVDMTLQHLGYGTPASLGSWVRLGRTIDQNVHQNGASPQSQVDMVQNQGWDHSVAGANVQCALTNSPI